MSHCKCKPKIGPRNLATPIVDLYRDLLTSQDLAEVGARAMELMKASSTHGIQSAAKCWGEAFLSLLLQRGLLRPYMSILNDENFPNK